MLIERLKLSLATMPLAHSLNPALLRTAVDIVPILIDASNEEEISESVSRYASSQRSSGIFRQKVLSERKSEVERCIDHLRLTTHSGKNTMTNSAHPLVPNFYLDSTNAFSISYHGVGASDANSIGCVVGFSVLNTPLINSSGYMKNMNWRFFEEGDVLIDQIQATNANGTREVLSTFRWEKVLVGLVIDWAAQSGLTRIFVRPAKFNKYTVINNGAGNRGLIRYDVTAKRMGFKKLGEDLPYMLDLSQAPLSDEVF